MNSVGFYSGLRVVIRDPYPVFKHVCRFKKHRSKRNWTPRVRTFSHYAAIIEDGQVIQDRIHDVLYMTSKTWAQVKNSIAAHSPETSE